LVAYGYTHVTLAFDCLLAAYLLLASLTIWCAQASITVLIVQTGPVPAHGSGLPVTRSAETVLRVVAQGLAALPYGLGSLACLVAALALLVGTPFDIRYAAIAVFGVALYLTLINLTHLIEDWQHGVPPERMLCVRSLLPAVLALPMVLAGLRLI